MFFSVFFLLNDDITDIKISVTILFYADIRHHWKIDEFQTDRFSST